MIHKKTDPSVLTTSSSRRCTITTDEDRNIVEYIFDDFEAPSSPTHAPVSIVCHSYNHEPYIADALKGFESQPDHLVHEIIINDDCSTDRTVEILLKWADKTRKPVRIIAHTKNKWMNKGSRPAEHTFLKAGGDYIAFCEGDDFWTEPDKLTKQLEAMRRHPSVDLCTHAAWRLSMSNGQKSRHFDHGQQELTISPERVIARHNQFSASASIFMRAQAARSMPDWFFHEPGLAVTDFFIESILGRKGVLYLPETMSVYRRDVPGSYTNRFRHAGGEKLGKSLDRMLYFTEKLRGMPGIPEHALDQRLSYVRLNYALQFLAAGDQERYIAASRKIRLDGHRLPQLALALMRQNRLAFRVGREAFLALRRLQL